MRCALLFTTILLFAIVPFSNPVTADGLDENSGITISASFDNSTELTTINITMPLTNNATLLDEMKDTTFSIYRLVEGLGWIDTETIVSEIQFCTQGSSNSECSGGSFEIEHYPLLVDGGFEPTNINYLLAFNNVSILSNTLEEIITPSFAVENLTGTYSDDVTTLAWDYPEGIPMNHSIMIYSHDSPATRESWNGLTKTIISSSVSAGTTSYDINYSGELIERDIFYSVTLLYDTSEDTRFIGSNTLTNSLWEDNTAPLFLGELEVTFNSDTDVTTIDWGEGIFDEDLVINIYRSDTELLILDSNSLTATVDASSPSFDLPIPIGEHRQSWYAISLEDSEGNEVQTLTESSPVAGPIIETTISSSTITNIIVDRNIDGSITLNWDESISDPYAIAKVWRSITGPIDSFEDLEELISTNVSNQQFTHDPINPVDEAWYAITIEAIWGSSAIPWHDETLIAGVNSMITPIRETEDIVVEPTPGVLAQVQSSTGAGGSISDGSLISLGAMYEGDIIIISTSIMVDKISCNNMTSEVFVVFSHWALTFDANQSDETCLGTIIDGDTEIGFTLTWNYIETIPNNSNDTSNETADDDDDDNEQQEAEGDGEVEEKGTVASIILAIIILILLVYLLVMMRSPNYEEEE
jgi:hypothetical protein